MADTTLSLQKSAPAQVADPIADAAMVPPEHDAGVCTRMLSALMLGGVVAGLAYGASVAYDAARDSFVAPIILSPDSDVVVGNKLRMSELQVERARAAAELEGCEADLQATESAIRRLGELRPAAASGREWFSEITSHRAWTTAAELRALDGQRSVLQEMRRKQADLTNRAKADMESGVISQTDYAKEVMTLNQMDLALLENERERLDRGSVMHEGKLAQRALQQRDGAALAPELITREEQVVRIEMEMLRLESERRSRTAQKRALAERIQQIDQIAAQLRTRPIYQAVERSLDVAFVPYTQIDGVERGAGVYSCAWGLFLCKPVGTVTELVPGEVVLPDPWGTQARGQYAVLELRDQDVAKAKTLRVRKRGGPAAAMPAAALAAAPR